MQIQNFLDMKTLMEYVDQGIVTCRKHPYLPLKVYNYSPVAQSIKIWDNTLSFCRGLVVEDGTNEIICHCFKKFWNYGDKAHIAEIRPPSDAVIYKKYDGSYLALFWYKDQPVVCTRGSFESDQAKWAAKWVKENIKPYDVSSFDKKFRYICEVIIPEDRKVVRYDFSGLVLLGAIDEEGNEFPPHEVFESQISYFTLGLRLPRLYQIRI